MSAPILQTDDLQVRLGGRTIVDKAAVSLRPGELVILVGPNGAGKTTLMRALAGLLPAQGRIRWNGGRLPSSPRASAHAAWPICRRVTISTGRWRWSRSSGLGAIRMAILSPHRRRPTGKP